jgi:hypothetical protein
MILQAEIGFGWTFGDETSQLLEIERPTIRFAYQIVKDREALDLQVRAGFNEGQTLR